jgi:hypothetical protein
VCGPAEASTSGATIMTHLNRLRADVKVLGIAAPARIACHLDHFNQLRADFLRPSEVRRVHRLAALFPPPRVHCGTHIHLQTATRRCARHPNRTPTQWSPQTAVAVDSSGVHSGGAHRGAHRPPQRPAPRAYASRLPRQSYQLRMRRRRIRRPCPRAQTTSRRTFHHITQRVSGRMMDGAQDASDALTIASVGTHARVTRAVPASVRRRHRRVAV